MTGLVYVFRQIRVFLRRRARRLPGRLLMIIVATGSYALMFAPYEILFPPVFAFAIGYVAIRYTSPLESIALCFLVVIVAYAMTTYWTIAFHTATVLLIPLTLAPRFGVLSYIGLRLRLYTPYVFVVGYTFGQYLFEFFPGLPWIRLGTAFATWPVLLQPVSFMGEFLYEALFVLVGALLGECLTRMRSAPWYELGISVAVLLSVIAAGAVIHYQPVTEKQQRLMLVQPGIDSEIGASDEQIRRQNQRRRRSLHRQTHRYGREGDIVLWPETSGPKTRRTDGVVRFANQKYAKHLRDYFDRDFTILSGSRLRAPDNGRPPILNAAVSYRTDGTIKDHYTKHLVIPLAEYLPRTGWYQYLDPIRSYIGTRDYRPGQKTAPLSVRGVDVAPMICYENAFYGYVNRRVREGADVIAVLTSDSWSGSVAAHKQHYARSRVRAVEFGMTVAHVGNTGITGIIGPRGRDQSGPLSAYRTGVVRGPIHEPVTTLYGQYGRTITYGGLLVLLGIGLVKLYGPFRR